jgi:hypothetical protein
MNFLPSFERDLDLGLNDLFLFRLADLDLDLFYGGESFCSGRRLILSAFPSFALSI